VVFSIEPGFLHSPGSIHKSPPPPANWSLLRSNRGFAFPSSKLHLSTMPSWKNVKASLLLVYSVSIVCLDIGIWTPICGLHFFDINSRARTCLTRAFFGSLPKKKNAPSDNFTWQFAPNQKESWTINLNWSFSRNSILLHLNPRVDFSPFQQLWCTLKIIKTILFLFSSSFLSVARLRPKSSQIWKGLWFAFLSYPSACLQKRVKNRSIWRANFDITSRKNKPFLFFLEKNPNFFENYFTTHTVWKDRFFPFSIN